MALSMDRRFFCLHSKEANVKASSVVITQIQRLVVMIPERDLCCGIQIKLQAVDILQKSRQGHTEENN